MQLRIGVSSHADVSSAVIEAARAARKGCSAPALALVFSTVEYPPQAVAEVLGRELGALPTAGCTTPAILAGTTIVKRGVAVGIVDSPRVRVGVGSAGPVSAGARDAGRRAALAALADMPLTPSDRSRAMLLFADTAGGDAADAVHGALGAAGAGIAWSGGGTGGPGSAQFAGGRALHDEVVAVALDCHARVGSGVQHGWSPSGPPAMVTGVNGLLVECLEHRPAFEIYRAAAEERGHYVDEKQFTSFAMTHPLGIPQADGEYLIRDPIALEAGGALRVMATVPDGALVRLMEGTEKTLVAAARFAAKAAREGAGHNLGGALVFDCISRHLILGDRLAHELAACQDAIGADVPLFGCLTFGEVGAFGARLPQFHNKTMVVLALPA